MPVASKERTEQPMVVKKYRDRETSPERTKVWTEPKPKAERKVAVVYYLCKNGQLEHPHFMEVPLSSPEGLYLRDVINRLNVLRGKGMASMYSWSAKRSYKNGFVWHDLCENDFIYPAHGQEYVLKGSELLEAAPSSRSQGTVSSSPEKMPDIQKSDKNEFPASRRRNQSWSHLDHTEYKVYKTETTNETALQAANASTQTDDRSRRRRKPLAREDRKQKTIPEQLQEEIISTDETELSREEISPPPSTSSPETLESLMKADGRVTLSVIEEADIRDRSANHPSGRMKASTVLMQLISCGSIAVKDHGLSLISHYRGRLPRGGGGGGSDQTTKVIESLMDNSSFGAVRLEDKEYFSGSLIETKKDTGGTAEFQGFQRSSSYNADRSSKSDLMEMEADDARAKCIPRKPKHSPAKKGSNNVISRSAHNSNRISAEAVKSAIAS
ncbi:protein SOSEKI 5-like [Aristolochia californica]|uniref:protein SOSEKI 5-like n=1 Tax=Aristolochia californica TaxID=171875 RepID=UPI0035D615DD